MDAGLLIRWGQVVPGREEQALALFTETVTFFETLKEGKKLSSYEPFMYSTADFAAETGFFVLKGPVTEIFGLMDSDAYKTLITKANLLLQHLTINLLTVGDEIAGQLDRYDKARMELHI